MKSVCYTRVVETDDGSNATRTPTDGSLELNARIGRYPGRESLAWVWGPQESLLCAKDRKCSREAMQGANFVGVELACVTAIWSEGSSGGGYIRDFLC